MRRLVGFLTIACLVLAGCQRSHPTTEGAAGASVDGFQVDGVFYAQWTAVTSHPKGVRPLGAADLGRVLGWVVANPANEPVASGAAFCNLEATLLPVGTPVHAVKGDPTSFRLAANNHGRVALYEPWSSPRAQVGADLLGGIQGRVRRIGVYTFDERRRLLGLINDRQQVAQLVRLVLRAPLVEQDPRRGPQDDEPYLVSFHLKDATATSRAFNAKTGFLAGGVVVADKFTAAVRQAIAHHQTAATP